MAETFDKELFGRDIHSTAVALTSPVSPALTRRVLDTFAENFASGAVLWKITDRPGDQLSYRFFSRLKTDTIAQAVQARLLAPDNPLIPYAEAWTNLYDSAVQSCDFDAGDGLAKTWIWLGGPRPTEDVLAPTTLSGITGTFTTLGLNHIRFVAVDWRHHTANLYFRARGPLTRAHLARITDLARASKPPADVVDQVLSYIPEDYCVAVTVCPDDGQIERTCFYALKIPPEKFPPLLPDRIRRFFDTAPCYDAEECNVVGWSFGYDGDYIKAERSRTGSMTAVLTDWNCFFHGEEGRDTALRSTT